MPSAREGPPQPSRPPASGVGGVHSILPRAGRRQPRGGRVAPRAGPSHGLRGQATTEPVVHLWTPPLMQAFLRTVRHAFRAVIWDDSVCGQVQSSVRPHDAAGLTPRACMETRTGGRRQPRRGRVAPRAGPSHGLRGQATTEPVVHLWTPPLMQAFLRTVRHMRSGAVICPAS